MVRITVEVDGKSEVFSFEALGAADALRRLARVHDAPRAEGDGLRAVRDALRATG